MGPSTPAWDPVEERFRVRPAEGLADGGFAKHEDMEETQRAGTTV
jgi:hypothetical protein